MAPRIKHFLVHLESGQRYPVTDEIIIGRKTGDILFPEDPKISNAHCRVLPTDGGLAVEDLESSNGTYVDRQRLEPAKTYLLKVGSSLSLGAQTLRLEEAADGEKFARLAKRHKPRNSGFDPMWTVGLVLILAFSYFGWRWYSARQNAQPVYTGPIQTPRELVEKEMRGAFELYQELGRTHTSGKISDRELAAKIRERLLPALESARVKMEVIRGHSEWEKKKVEANKELLKALIGQVKAMAFYNETKDPKFAKSVESFSAQVEAANRKVKELESSRLPTAY